MSAYLQDMIKSGKKIITDTKVAAKMVESGGKKKVAPMDTPVETNPHKMLIRRTIQEKPKKSELVEQFKKFIQAAEDCI
jgi:hypothetical protein